MLLFAGHSYDPGVKYTFCVHQRGLTAHYHVYILVCFRRFFGATTDERYLLPLQRFFQAAHGDRVFCSLARHLSAGAMRGGV